MKIEEKLTDGSKIIMTLDDDNAPSVIIVGNQAAMSNREELVS